MILGILIFDTKIGIGSPTVIFLSAFWPLIPWVHSTGFFPVEVQTDFDEAVGNDVERIEFLGLMIRAYEKPLVSLKAEN